MMRAPVARRDMGPVERVADFLQGEVLLATDEHPAAGLSYHLADVWVPELLGVCSTGRAAPSAALHALLEPFWRALAHTRRPALVHRLRYGPGPAWVELLLAALRGSWWHCLV